MRRLSKRTAGLDPEMVQLHDFELYDDGSGVSVVVFGAELTDVATALAHSNGFTVGELLSNEAIPADIPLSCCMVEKLPKARGWSIDASGYVLVKLKRSPTMAGHSFLGSTRASDADRDYAGTSTDERCPQIFEALSPQPRKRRCLTRPEWLQSFSMSPGSPDSEVAGCSHPLPIRWHRAAALSLSSDLAADCGLVVRHICGNKRCAKVSHFRFGSQSDNEKDEAYHKVNPSCSREAFPERE